MKLYLIVLLASLPAIAGGDVVRIHDLTPGELAALRDRHDFWGVDWREDYAVFDLDPVQRRRLEQAGFRITTDDMRTGELKSWRAAAKRARTRGGVSGTIPGFACYRTVDATHSALAALATAFSDRASWVEIGETWQAGAGSEPGDSIFALVISNTNSPHAKAPLVVFAAQHARELATAEIATRFAELLLENPADDPDIDWLLDHREIHIVAQANPDGRRRVEAGAQMWRKNHNESACPSGNLSFTWPGIDLNRNSSFLWGEFSSGNACAQTYRGPALASEPETQAIQSYLASVFDVQRPANDLISPAPSDAEGVFISLHSFSELVLFPWEGLGGQNENNAPNHNGLAILGRRFGFLNDYAVGRQLLPPAGGTTVDFAYGDFGVAAYTFEVGTSFTQPCASFESTVWPDNRDALLLAAKAARRPYQAPAGPEITALETDFSDGALRVSGSADDSRYFSGGANEPPADPVSNVVELRVSIGLPEHLADQTWVFPVGTPAEQISFDIALPPASLPGSGKLFVTAVDDSGQVGLPRVVYSELIHISGFEAEAPLNP